MDTKNGEHNNSRNELFDYSLDWVLQVLSRYFSNQLKETEAEKVKRTIDALPNPKVAPLSNRVVEKSHKRIWHGLETQIPPLNTPNNRTRVLHPLFPIGIAATLIMALFFIKGGTILDHYRANNLSYLEASLQTLIQTGEGEMKELILPDGSKIWANADTELKYHGDYFNKHKREVWLEGEAFFEIAENAQKPFIIYTGEVKTTVRGTSFNIKAYAEIGEVGVSVRDGKVEVAERKGESLATLTANQRIVYDHAAHSVRLEDSDWKNDVAWQEGRLILQDANLVELKLRLKQLYGVELVIESGIHPEERLGLFFRKGATLEEVLELLSDLYGVEYRITGHQVVIHHQGAI